MSEAMHECKYNPGFMRDTLIPQVGIITDIRTETPDVKTFRVNAPGGGKLFEHLPGQCAMVCAPGVGEAMFSITAFGEDWIESSIKMVGELTEAMHELSVGDCVGLRGPYGNGFPVDELKGYDVLFIGGGIGAAPVRSVIRWCLEHREDYGRFNIVCGARTIDDVPFKDDFFELWPRMENTGVYVTTDRPTNNWNGNVGFIPDYIEKLEFSPENTKIVMCGPSIMVRLTAQRLAQMGFAREDIITSMETRMKCGIGKCGRCNIGSKFICLDGPVFTLTELDELPDE